MAEVETLVDEQNPAEVDQSDIPEETLSKGLACVLNRFAESTGYVQYG